MARQFHTLDRLLAAPSDQKLDIYIYAGFQNERAAEKAHCEAAVQRSELICP